MRFCCRVLFPAPRGFTLLELMIVISIIMILASIAVVHSERTIALARQAVLRQDLAEMRQAIQNYTRDKEAAPTSLDDLVSARYLGEVPIDPITRQADWHTEDCDAMPGPDQFSAGICDVHSASDKISPSGNAYSSW